ncbi:MAG TPA: flagellar export chaperone FliS [Bryobacteraceae bacterium]|nr:flagellar export chaperone FliS [Bryobacteraceae bacterium]
MAYSNYGKYLEAEVFGADPVEQVCILYRGAMEATAAARRHLQAREIPERSRQIMRAFAILSELSRALDPKYEKISRPLGELYAYMSRQLLEANAKQIDAPLAEVEGLLATLYDGWKNARPALAVAAVEAYQPLSCTY